MSKDCVSAFASHVRMLLKMQDLKQQDLALKCEMTPSQLSRMLNGGVTLGKLDMPDGLLMIVVGLGTLGVLECDDDLEELLKYVRTRYFSEKGRKYVFDNIGPELAKKGILWNKKRIERAIVEILYHDKKAAEGRNWLNQALSSLGLGDLAYWQKMIDERNQKLQQDKNNEPPDVEA